MARRHGLLQLVLAVLFFSFLLLAGTGFCFNRYTNANLRKFRRGSGSLGLAQKHRRSTNVSFYAPFTTIEGQTYYIHTATVGALPSTISPRRTPTPEQRPKP